MVRPTVTSDTVREYAKRAGFELSEKDAEEHLQQLETQGDILSKLDELGAPTPPDRDYWRPDEEADPNAAFLLRCDLQRSEEGLLGGRTIAVKDNIAVAGLPMTCGSPFLEDFIPSRDATVVDRLLDAGGTLRGKSNMDEFALGGEPDAMRFRLARNPHDTGRMPGGSSAGSGVAVAEGAVDVALGTDTGGSVRFPASFCGVVGVKPTRGLVSLDGFVQFSKTLDTIGTLSATVEDSARALQVMAGEDERDPATSGKTAGDYVAAVERGRSEGPDGLTIGLPVELFGHATDVETAVEAAVEELASEGATVTTVSIEEFEYAIPSWLAISMTEMAAYFEANAVNYWQPAEGSLDLTDHLAAASRQDREDLGPYVESTLLSGRHLIDTHENRYYVRAQRGRRLVTDSIEALFDSVDVLACPTTPLLPPEWEHGYLEDNSLYEVVRNTGVFNLTGHPAVSVPCGEVDGLPVGLQFVAPLEEDATALHTAAAWESVRNGRSA